jgi:hypothetical protein
MKLVAKIIRIITTLTFLPAAATLPCRLIFAEVFFKRIFMISLTGQQPQYISRSGNSLSSYERVVRSSGRKQSHAYHLTDSLQRVQLLAGIALGSIKVVVNKTMCAFLQTSKDTEGNVDAGHTLSFLNATGVQFNAASRLYPPDSGRPGSPGGFVIFSSSDADEDSETSVALEDSD